MDASITCTGRNTHAMSDAMIHDQKTAADIDGPHWPANHAIGRIDVDLLTQTITADYEDARPLHKPLPHQVFITRYPDSYQFSDAVPSDSLKLHIGAPAFGPLHQELRLGARAGYQEAESGTAPGEGHRLVTGTPFHLAYRAGYIAYLTFERKTAS